MCRRVSGLVGSDQPQHSLKPEPHPQHGPYQSAGAADGAGLKVKLRGVRKDVTALLWSGAEPAVFYGTMLLSTGFSI